MNGASIGITAARRATEQAALVRALGGQPIIGSAIRADLPAPDDEVAPLLREATSAPIDDAVFLTGVGAEVAFAIAARTGLESAMRTSLAHACVTARGPKPRRALRQLGVRIDRVMEPASSEAILELLLRGPLAGRRILIQGFGPHPHELVAPLRAAGAEVIAISPYAAHAPEQPGPARTLAAMAAAGSLAALTFTSAGAAEEFLRIAASIDISPSELAEAGCLMCAVGPVTRVRMEDLGLAVDVEPAAPKMGALYHAVSAALTRGRAANHGQIVHGALAPAFLA